MGQQQERPLWEEYIAPRGPMTGVRKHWHLLAVIVALLVTLVLVILGITQNVTGFKAYPAWVMVIWITLNVVIFLGLLLLSLRYLFRAIRTNESGEAIILLILLFICFIGGLVSTANVPGAFAFAAVNLTAAFAMLVYDILLIFIPNLFK